MIDKITATPLDCLLMFSGDAWVMTRHAVGMRRLVDVGHNMIDDLRRYESQAR